MGRSAKRNMKLKCISTRLFIFDVIVVQCTTLVSSVTTINTFYEQCFYVLVNEEPREQPVF
jgi:hypothetical protein